MRGLSGKVAIVPGGATKIGQAVVRAFQEAGTRVMVADIDESGAAWSKSTSHPALSSGGMQSAQVRNSFSVSWFMASQ